MIFHWMPEKKFSCKTWISPKYWTHSTVPPSSERNKQLTLYSTMRRSRVSRVHLGRKTSFGTLLSMRFSHSRSNRNCNCKSVKNKTKLQITITPFPIRRSQVIRGSCFFLFFAKLIVFAHIAEEKTEDDNNGIRNFVHTRNGNFSVSLAAYGNRLVVGACWAGAHIGHSEILQVAIFPRHFTVEAATAFY